MKTNISRLAASFFSAENRAKSFYLLALIPVVLLSYFYMQSPFALAIPVYAVVILAIKKSKLFAQPAGSIYQKAFGLVVIAVSFFVYFILAPFFPNMVLYGFANYSLYIIGLFLLFFKINTLKEAISPLLLVAASFVGSFLSDLAKLYFEPYLVNFTSFIASLLRVLGIATLQSSSSHTNIITMLNTVNGQIALSIVWGCIGFTSMFVFSVILIVIMLEEQSSAQTKVLWSMLGVIGTFFVNIIRIVIIFVGIFFYGHQFYDIHLYLGYILFVAWTALFLFLFSKRNTLLQGIRITYAKISRIFVQNNQS